MASSSSTYQLLPTQQTIYVQRMMRPFFVSMWVALSLLLPAVVYAIFVILPISYTAGLVFLFTILGFTFLLIYSLYRSLRKIHQHIAASISVVIDQQGVSRQLTEDQRPPIDGFNKVTYRNLKRLFNQAPQIDFKAIAAIEWQNDDLWVQTIETDPTTGAGILHIPKELDQVEVVEQHIRQYWQAAQCS